MSIELKRDRDKNGDVFYAVYHDGERMVGVYAGNDLKDEDFQNKDRIKEEEAITLYDNYINSQKTGASSRVIKSTEEKGHLN